MRASDYSAYWIRDAAICQTGQVHRRGDSGEPEGQRRVGGVRHQAAGKAKNVILFIGDGLSVAHRTAARILSKGIVEGRYGGELAIDDMPHMALVSTSGTDSIVTDSANSMSARTRPATNPASMRSGSTARGTRTTLEHPQVETISEFVKRARGMSVGVVTNTEIEDATPAGMVAHTRRRGDYNDIVKMFFAVQPEVILGGGSAELPAEVNARLQADR